jgi:hypothetical protein
MAGIAMNAEQQRPDARPNVVSQLRRSRVKEECFNGFGHVQSAIVVAGKRGAILVFGYALAIHSQDVTGFDAKNTGISLAKIISDETSLLLMRSKMNGFHYKLALSNGFSIDFVEFGHIRCCRCPHRIGLKAQRARALTIPYANYSSFW